MKTLAKILLCTCFTCFHLKEVHGQIDSASVRFPQLTAAQNNHHLVNKAVDGAVYLVKQEYYLKSPSGQKVGRGILSYYGQTYRVGILVNRDLWIPSSIRQPWKFDPNYKDRKEEHSPVALSEIGIRNINLMEEFRTFPLVNQVDTTNSLWSFSYGLIGLDVSDSLPASGNLTLYYLDANKSPEDAPVKSTTIRLKDIVWDKSGIAEIIDVHYKDRIILGGVMFSEKVSLGRIDIELVAIYTDMDNNWVLQAVRPLQYASSK